MSDWQYYEGADDKGCATITLVDTEYQRNVDLRKGRPWLAMVSVVRADAEEVGGLQKLQNIVVQSIAKNANGIVVGRVDRAEISEFWCYMEDRNDISGSIQAITGSAVRLRTMLERDDNWGAYRTVLLPHTPEQIQQVANGQIIKRLKDAGDNKTLHKKIYHATRFRTKQAAETHRSVLEPHGFTDFRTAEINDPTFKVVCEFEQVLPELSVSLVNQATNNLMELATRLGGKYDGWGSIVRSNRDV